MGRHQPEHRLPLQGDGRTSAAAQLQEEEGERTRSLPALSPQAVERGLPQRQAPPRRDPRPRLAPQRRHGEQAALQLPLHGGPGEGALPRTEGEEGYHRRRFPDRQE